MLKALNKAKVRDIYNKTAGYYDIYQNLEFYVFIEKVCLISLSNRGNHEKNIVFKVFRYFFDSVDWI